MQKGDKKLLQGNNSLKPTQPSLQLASEYAARFLSFTCDFNLKPLSYSCTAASQPLCSARGAQKKLRQK